jgi:hypothetical protein
MADTAATLAMTFAAIRGGLLLLTVMRLRAALAAKSAIVTSRGTPAPAGANRNIFANGAGQKIPVPTDLPVVPMCRRHDRCPRPQIKTISFAIPPHRGAYHDRHLRGTGCDGRDSVGRATGSQGGCCRERSAGARTNGAANRLRQNSPDRTRSGKTFGADGRGRRSRVVLAPRRWRQVLWRCIRPNRARDASSIRRATVARKPGHRGEHEVSRNPFARGKPERSG